MAQVRMMLVPPGQKLQCPICGCFEVNEELHVLNIRGFKVQDKHGDWSQCLLPHDPQIIDGVEVEITSLWFNQESWISGRPLMEINGKLVEYEK